MNNDQIVRTVRTRPMECIGLYIGREMGIHHTVAVVVVAVVAAAAGVGDVAAVDAVDAAVGQDKCL